VIQVVVWKWHPLGPKWDRVTYTADHVNRFASMVGRHLSLPHEVVCITDDAEGIDGSVRIVPLWDDLREFGMCWTRLKVFAPEMADIIGPRFVSIDLDCVIVGRLDPLLDIPDDFKAWKNVGRGAIYCGSMFLLNAGSRRQVWDDLDPGKLVFKKEFGRFKHRGNRYIHPEAYAAGMVCGSDQAWMSYVLGPGGPMWTSVDGVLSHSDGSLIPSGLGRPKHDTPPDHARIVFFHGVGDPSQPRVQKQHPWIERFWK